MSKTVLLIVPFYCVDFSTVLAITSIAPNTCKTSHPLEWLVTNKVPSISTNTLQRTRARPLPPACPHCVPADSRKSGLLNAEGRTTTGKSPCASGAVLRAVADCLETIGGRVFLMTQSPPNTGAGGINAAREDSSLYGGDKEFRLYQPATATGGGSKAENAAAWATAEFYRLLAKDCAARQVKVILSF